MADCHPLDALELATEVTIAWLGNPSNPVTASDVPAFLAAVHATITTLSHGPAEGVDAMASAQDALLAESVRQSLASKDHIISMIDGKPYKALRRHLSTHGMTPDQYRERYNLRADYPMVAENYSMTRREIAKKIGLGRKPLPTEDGTAVPTEVPRRDPKPS